MSWNKSRFSQWEVEGEVRQRVGKVLAEAEQGRLAHQCQGARESSAITRAICSLNAGLSSLTVRVGVGWLAVRTRMRASQVLEKGAE